MAGSHNVDRDANGQPAMRVIVTDDDPLVRRLIRDTLHDAGVTVVAEAGSGQDAIELALFYRPEVVLMDYLMPGMDGVEATRRLHAEDPSIHVVILTSLDGDEIALLALRAGAAGYLSKDMDLEALPRALYGVRDGEAAISRRLAMTLVERYCAASTGGAGLRPVRSPLTDREWEVLDLLASGITVEAIADELVLSSETVRSHVKHLYRKLEVNSRQDAVRVASRMRSDAHLAADGPSPAEASPPVACGARPAGRAARPANDRPTTALPGTRRARPRVRSLR